jgi:DNA-binding MarR family transcriptional regulator
MILRLELAKDHYAMPKARTRSPLVSKDAEGRPPVGALLRINYQTTRSRQFKALIEHGFDDLNQALLTVMVCPFLDDVHPSDLAVQTNMTSQAMNHLLGRLETLGYVSRRAKKRRSRTLVFLTRRGWRAVGTARQAEKQLEAEWATILGRKRFNEFLDTLRQLSSSDAHADLPLPRRGRKTRVI